MWRGARQRSVVLIGGILLALGGAVACAETAPKPPPRLEFAELSHHAGEIAQGESIRHRFAFRNAGGRELRLRDVRISCDCRVRVDADEVIAAGATGTIELELDTSNLAGAIRRTASVLSNDPQAPVLRLMLTADVAPIVVIEPRELYVGLVKPGERAKAEARVSFADGSRAEFLELTATGAVAEPHWTTTVDTDSGRSFSLVIAEDAPLGRFAETIVIRTDHPQRRRIEVRVAGVVVGE